MTPSLPPNTRWATNIYGQKLLVDPDDFIGKKVLRNKIYDLETLLLLEKLFSALGPALILDVGANIGNHTLMFSRHADRVVSFEPGRRAFDLLSRNIAANALGHVIPCNVGLSDADATQTLYVEAAGNLGGSSLSRDALCGVAYEEDTITLRLGDSVISELGLGRVDFLKIDVEGHERAVIRGLRKTLLQHRPVMLMEWESDRDWLFDESGFSEIFEGYDFYPLIWNTSREYWRRKPLGAIRRTGLRVFGTKHRVPCPLDVCRGFPRISDILLVPNEKRSLVSPLVFQ